MKTKHKTFAALLTAALALAITLAGCGDQTERMYKPGKLALNTISQVKMTAREQALTDVRRGYTFMFDFKVDESYGAVNVWVERYDFGVLAEPRDSGSESTFSVGSDDPGPMSGGIVIAVYPIVDDAGVMADDRSAVQMLATNGWSTTYGPVSVIEIPEKLSGGAIVSNIQRETPIDGVLELAQMSYTNHGASFSPNPETNAELRKQHDVTYLIKCEFIKKLDLT